MSSTPPSTESSPAPDDLPFHARPVDEVLRHLDSGHHGLTHEAAAERLARHGPNRLETRPPAGLLKRFALQFHNVLVYVLLVSATVLAGFYSANGQLYRFAAPELAAPDWEPTFVDYLYVSFTNATAFSPTDVLPLTRWAKLTMMLQSTISFTTVLLVIARAVNILG